MSKELDAIIEALIQEEGAQRELIAGRARQHAVTIARMGGERSRLIAQVEELQAENEALRGQVAAKPAPKAPLMEGRPPDSPTSHD